MTAENYKTMLENEENNMSGDVNAAGMDQSAAEKAEANKPAEEAALDNAAVEAGGADVAGEKVETDTGAEVFFEGRKVVRVLPEDQQGAAPKGFVRSEMSDATIVDVPEELFAGDLDAFKEAAEEKKADAENS